MMNFCCLPQTTTTYIFERLAVDNIEGAINFFLRDEPALKKKEELIDLNAE